MPLGIPEYYKKTCHLTFHFLIPIKQYNYENFFFLLLLAIVAFSACQKEVIEPATPISTTPPIDTTLLVDTPPAPVATTTLTLSNSAHSDYSMGNTTASISVPPIIPFEVGNKWIYRRTVASFGSPTVVDTIEYLMTDSLIIHNKKYYKLTLITPTFTRSEPYTTRQNGEYIRRDISSGVETTFLKDNLSVGDSWMGPPEFTVVDINKSVYTPAGAFNGVVSIRQFELDTGWPTRTSTIVYDYKEGVGLVQESRRYQYGHMVTTTTLQLISYTLN